jgi:hypothetical protein
MKKNRLAFSNFSTNPEAGAALVTVLMISSLLLVACLGMLTATAYNTKNISDAIYEDKAYYAAENGLQATINVLRRNTSPNLLFSATPSDPSNTISFIKAIKPSTSNKPTDNSPKARLSRWLNYNYTPSGATAPDRVVFGENPSTYNPATGAAYSVEVMDPDNSQNFITYSTLGSFISFDTEGDVISGKISPDGKSVTYGTGLNTTTIVYISTLPTIIDVSSGTANTSLGYFQIIKTGTGADIVDALRFQIAYTTVLPHQASRYIRGTIQQTSSSKVSIVTDSQLYLLMGSTITLETTSMELSLLLATSTTINLRANITAPEPLRLLIKSTGYGPHGAKKTLEATIQKNFFSDLSAPAALTLVGLSTNFKFDPGNSANVTYSGDDVATNADIPSIGLTNALNLQTVLQTDIKTELDPPAANVNVELPDWLLSAQNLDATIKNLRTVAKASGRYYGNGVTPPDFGQISGTGITFADGDVSLNGDGGGILVCTGRLTLNGQVNFKGLIIVTGSQGVIRNGGGNGTLEGNTVVAPYNPSNPEAGFLSPRYDMSGGGTSTLRYNSNSVSNGLIAISNFVLGVSEK